MILGIDEAGRGPWAGPLVVGAVVLGTDINGLADSKKLTKQRRELLYDEIINQAQAVATGWVSAAELDKLGMSAALRLATRRAVEQIKVPYHEIIIDGTVNFLADTALGKYVTTLAKADALIASVSAASIIAKVERDRYMVFADDLYPSYGFVSNAGYGVAKHRAAIDQYGICIEHRLSFAPLAKYQTARLRPAVLPVKRTSRAVGNASETVASRELERRGHTIIDRNWKVRLCEIDIVSRLGDTYYFTEVKHRRSSKAGDGIAAITSRKLQQMKFAARVYAHYHHLTNHELRLIAVATTGDDEPVLVDLLEIS